MEADRGRRHDPDREVAQIVGSRAGGVHLQSTLVQPRAEFGKAEDGACSPRGPGGAGEPSVEFEADVGFRRGEAGGSGGAAGPLRALRTMTPCPVPDGAVVPPVSSTSTRAPFGSAGGRGA